MSTKDKPSRKRQIQINIRLSEKEYQKLNKNCEKTKLTQSGYIRNLILSVPIKTPPTRDYKRLYEEIAAIGNNVNQIARRCNQGEEVLLFKAQMLLYLDELYKLLDRNV